MPLRYSRTYCSTTGSDLSASSGQSRRPLLCVPPLVMASITMLISPLWSRWRCDSTTASSRARFILCLAAWTIVPGPGSNMMRVVPAARTTPPEDSSCRATMCRAPAVPRNVRVCSCRDDTREIITPPHYVARSGSLSYGGIPAAAYNCVYVYISGI